MMLIKWYFKLFNFIAEIRLKNQDLDPRRIHTHLATVLSTGLLMWSYAFLAYFSITSPVPGIVGFVCSSVHLLSPLIFRFSSNVFMISNLMLAAGMIHQSVFSYYTGGYSSNILIWFGILPMIGGIIAGKRGTILWAFLTSLTAGCYLYLHLNNHPFPKDISNLGWLIAHSYLIFGWIFLSSLIIYVLLSLNENRETLLNEQKAKIDDLFRVLFHDLAGPLSRSSIGLMLTKRDENPESLKTGLDIINRANEAMIEITQNVRRMYALSKGKISSDLSYFSLNEGVDYVSKLYSAELAKKNIKIEYDYRNYHGLEVLVESISFKNQVLGNALSNAIKFSPPNSKIIIKAYPFDKNFFAIEIADQGVGMPQELLGSLFDITKKTSRRGTNGETGTGFGMQIMKSFMEMYQGKILVESFEDTHPNPGTVIKLILKAKWGESGH